MNYKALVPKVAEVLAANPAWTNQQVADAINAETVEVLDAPSMEAVILWAGRHDAIYRLEQFANSGPKPERQLAKATLAILTSPHVSNLDLTNPEIATLVDDLVAVDIWNAAAQTDLLQTATQSVTWTSQNGCGGLSSGHIQSAREMI